MSTIIIAKYQFIFLLDNCLYLSVMVGDYLISNRFTCAQLTTLKSKASMFTLCLTKNDDDDDDSLDASKSSLNGLIY